jgi:hypothetical protein
MDVKGLLEEGMLFPRNLSTCLLLSSLTVLVPLQLCWKFVANGTNKLYEEKKKIKATLVHGAHNSLLNPLSPSTSHSIPVFFGQLT